MATASSRPTVTQHASSRPSVTSRVTSRPTVTQPSAALVHQAVLAAPLGPLSASASATVIHAATFDAPLGSLTAAAAATVVHPATLDAPLGALTGAATAVVKHPATLAAPLGSLTATATATVSTPAFNPVTQIPWTHAFWAGGTEFAALGLADGAAVTTWPDEIGTLDATQGTAGAKPAYRATGGSNSKPCIDADGGDRLSNAGSAPQEIAQPLTLVVIGKTDVATGGTFVSGGNAGSDRCQVYLGSNVWAHFAGTQVFTATSNTNWHLHAVFFSGASSVYELDGTSISTSNPGTQPHQGVSIFADNGGAGSFDGKIAFVGIYTGNARAHANWTSFKSGVASHYGLTIA